MSTKNQSRSTTLPSDIRNCRVFWPNRFSRTFISPGSESFTKSLAHSRQLALIGWVFERPVEVSVATSDSKSARQPQSDVDIIVALVASPEPDCILQLQVLLEAACARCTAGKLEPPHVVGLWRPPAPSSPGSSPPSPRTTAPLPASRPNIFLVATSSSPAEPALPVVLSISRAPSSQPSPRGGCGVGRQGPGLRVETLGVVMYTADQRPQFVRSRGNRYREGALQVPGAAAGGDGFIARLMQNFKPPDHHSAMAPSMGGGAGSAQAHTAASPLGVALACINAVPHIQRAARLESRGGAASWHSEATDDTSTRRVLGLARAGERALAGGARAVAACTGGLLAAAVELAARALETRIPAIALAPRGQPPCLALKDVSAAAQEVHHRLCFLRQALQRPCDPTDRCPPTTTAPCAAPPAGGPVRRDHASTSEADVTAWDEGLPYVGSEDVGRAEAVVGCMMDQVLGAGAAVVVALYGQVAAQWARGVVVWWQRWVLEECVAWLQDAPGGLKVHLGLTTLLGNASMVVGQGAERVGAAVAPALARVAAPALAGCCLLGGLRLAAAALADALALLHLHVAALHWATAALFRAQVYAIQHGWKLIRPPPVKVEVGVGDEQALIIEDVIVEKLIVGVLTLTPFLLLLPTTMTYYLLFFTAHSAVLLFRSLALAAAALPHAPPLLRLLLLAISSNRFHRPVHIRPLQPPPLARPECSAPQGPDSSPPPPASQAAATETPHRPRTRSVTRGEALASTPGRPRGASSPGGYDDAPAEAEEEAGQPEESEAGGVGVSEVRYAEVCPERPALATWLLPRMAAQLRLVTGTLQALATIMQALPGGLPLPLVLLPRPPIEERDRC